MLSTLVFFFLSSVSDAQMSFLTSSRFFGVDGKVDSETGSVVAQAARRIRSTNSTFQITQPSRNILYSA